MFCDIFLGKSSSNPPAICPGSVSQQSVLPALEQPTSTNVSSHLTTTNGGGIWHLNERATGDTAPTRGAGEHLSPHHGLCLQAMPRPPSWTSATPPPLGPGGVLAPASSPLPLPLPITPASAPSSSSQARGPPLQQPQLCRATPIVPLRKRRHQSLRRCPRAQQVGVGIGIGMSGLGAGIFPHSVEMSSHRL